MSSTRVDFYLLQDAADNEETAIQSKYALACRLIEKAYLRGHKVFVFCNNRQEAETLDELLWTFKEESFIPHNLQGEGPDKPPPIQIGSDEAVEPRGFSDILLNLSEIIPAFSQRFQRIMEIVPNAEQAKEISRVHYREYRAKGCALQTHQLALC